jgi:hypothetical protein
VSVAGLPIPAWLSGQWSPHLVAAAAFERDRREAAYPQAIADRRIGADDAQADFEAWVTIHDWLELGLKSLPVPWLDMEAAAKKALDRIDAKLREPGQGQDDLQARRGQLFVIHRGVARMRAWVDETNRQLQAASDERLRADAAAVA